MNLEETEKKNRKKNKKRKIEKKKRKKNPKTIHSLRLSTKSEILNATLLRSAAKRFFFFQLIRNLLGLLRCTENSIHCNDYNCLKMNLNEIAKRLVNLYIIWIGLDSSEKWSRRCS